MFSNNNTSLNGILKGYKSLIVLNSPDLTSQAIGKLGLLLGTKNIMVSYVDKGIYHISTDDSTIIMIAGSPKEKYTSESRKKLARIEALKDISFIVYGDSEGLTITDNTFEEDKESSNKHIEIKVGYKPNILNPNIA